MISEINSTSQTWGYLEFNYASWWKALSADNQSTEAIKQITAKGSDRAKIVVTSYLENSQISEIVAIEPKIKSLQNIEKASKKS